MTNEELVVHIKAKDNVAENMLKLWQQNRKFIHFMAKKYQGGSELEDLEQEGYLALCDAINGYDPEQGTPFINYAARWMHQKMRRYIQNNGTVRIPVHEGEKLREYKKLINDYRIHLGRKLTQYEIARDMGISDKVVRDLEKAANMERLRSLDCLLTIDDDTTTVGDMVPDDIDIETDVLEDVQREQLKAVIWPLVDLLPEQQGKVLRQLFQEGKTLKTTGESLGVSIERTRQVEAKAMRSLRCSRNASLLKSFLIDERVYSIGLTGTGVECFNRTWTSSTERAALFYM